MLKQKVIDKWYWVGRFLCQVFTLLFFQYRTSGKANVPRQGPVILAGNHQSFLDPVFCGIGVKRNVIYMARDTLFKGPAGWILKSVNAIPIKRGQADIGAMKLILSRLKEGLAVCMYPEGTRSTDGRITRFKPGFGLLCRRSKAAVVPVLVDGAFECWPRHKKLFSPGPVLICFGKPLPPERVAQMTNEQLADWTTTALRNLQHQARLKQGKEPYIYDD